METGGYGGSAGASPSRPVGRRPLDCPSLALRARIGRFLTGAVLFGTAGTETGRYVTGTGSLARASGSVTDGRRAAGRWIVPRLRFGLGLGGPLPLTGRRPVAAAGEVA
jgi:hypothetical protein